MISFRHSGNFKNTERFFKKASNINYTKILDFYGKAGVNALEKATPVDTGLTASSWEYSYKINKGSFLISWNNTNIENGTCVAILIQYDHGTKNGGYVQGIDYINPALKPIFDSLADQAWKEIANL